MRRRIVANMCKIVKYLWFQYFTLPCGTSLIHSFTAISVLEPDERHSCQVVYFSIYFIIFMDQSDQDDVFVKFFCVSYETLKTRLNSNCVVKFYTKNLNLKAWTFHFRRLTDSILIFHALIVFSLQIESKSSHRTAE